MAYYKDYDDDDDLDIDENDTDDIKLLDIMEHMTDDEAHSYLEELLKLDAESDKDRERAFIVNPDKVKQLKQLCNDIKYLLEECSAEYEIEVEQCKLIPN